MFVRGKSRGVLSALFVCVLVVVFASCAEHSVVKEKEYTQEGRLTYKATSVDNNVQSELRRVFDNKTIEGYGIFESDNEGLARRTAINLAVADLAAQVQTLVRSETVIYNNKDVRDVVENRVHALVNDYRVDSVGYDPGTNKYRARVSISGETLRREVEKNIER